MRSITTPTSPRCRSASGTPTSPPRGSEPAGGQCDVQGGALSALCNEWRNDGGLCGPLRRMSWRCTGSLRALARASADGRKLACQPDKAAVSFFLCSALEAIESAVQSRNRERYSVPHVEAVTVLIPGGRDTMRPPSRYHRGVKGWRNAASRMGICSRSSHG